MPRQRRDLSKARLTSKGIRTFSHNFFPVDDPEKDSIAAETALTLVLEDPRVVDPFVAWIEATSRSLFPDREALQATVLRVIREQLHLSYYWLLDWVEIVAVAAVPFSIRGQDIDVRVVEVTHPIEPRSDESLAEAARRVRREHRPPGGRRPKHGGTSIQQDVIYWYRRKVADPTTTTYALARERRSRLTTAITEDDKAIRLAIKRAEARLASIGEGSRSYIGLSITTRGNITND